MHSDDGVQRFRWRCPICGSTQTNKATDESGRTNAINALRAHLVASDGPEHGRRNSYPDGFDTGALAEYVVEVDKRGEPVERDG